MRAVRATLDAVVPDIARGVRAAIATVVPYYLGQTLGHPELVWVALGGWLGSLADPGGARRARAMGTFVFATVGGVMVAIAQAVAPWAWLATIFLSLFGFFTSMLRAVGGWGSSVGTVLLIAAAVAISSTTGSPVQDGLLFFVGASWAMLLSSIVWPVWTHRPMRRAVAAVFSTLAAYASELSTCLRETEPTKAGPHDARWGALARKHQRAIRAALEDARQVAVALRTRRSGESRLGGNLRMLIGNAELEFTTLIALSEELETLRDRGGREIMPQRLDALVQTYREIGDRLFHHNNVHAIDASDPPDLELAPGSPIAPLMARLAELSRVAVVVARAPDQVSVNNEARTAPIDLRARIPDLRDDVEDFLDALSPNSSIFRHSVRVMVTAAVAFNIGRHVSPTHAHWVTITAFAVLQPYAGSVIGRAIERIVGTMFGSVTAVMLMIALHAPWAQALAMFPLSTAAVVTRPRSYRLFTFFLTPVFVLFADHGRSDWWTAAARAGDAVIGGLIALVFALVIFPSREQKRLADAMASVVAALAHYADTMFDIFESAGSVPSRGTSAARDLGASARTSAARRSIGIALGEAETSLERMLAEPRSFQQRAEDVVQLMTYTRRLSAALTALDLQVAHSRAADPMDRVALVAPLRAYVKAVLSAIDSFIRRRPNVSIPPPPVLPPHLPSPVGPALARVLRYAEFVASIIHERNPPAKTRQREAPAAVVG